MGLSLVNPDYAGTGSGAKWVDVVSVYDTTSARHSLPVTIVGESSVTVSVSIPGTVSITPTGTQSVNQVQVGGASISLGQKSMSAAYPVVIASDQSTLTVAGSGTFSVKQVETLTVSHPATLSVVQTAVVTVSGTTSVGNSPTISSVTTVATVNTVSTVTTVGTVNTVSTVTTLGTVNTLSVLSGGGVADNSPDSGNPVKVGGRVKDVADTYSVGDRADAQFDTRGYLKVLDQNTVSGFDTATDLWKFDLKRVGSASVSLGRTTSAASLPVVLPTDFTQSVSVVGTTSVTTVNTQTVSGTVSVNNTVSVVQTAVVTVSGTASVGNVPTVSHTLSVFTGTIVATTSAVASFTTSDFTVSGAKDGYFFLYWDEQGGVAPTLDVVIQAKSTVTGRYSQVATFPQKTTGGPVQAFGVMGLSVADTADSDFGVSFPVPHVLRAVATIAGTTPTYSLTLSFEGRV